MSESSLETCSIMQQLDKEKSGAIGYCQTEQKFFTQKEFDEKCRGHWCIVRRARIPQPGDPDYYLMRGVRK